MKNQFLKSFLFILALSFLFSACMEDSEKDDSTDSNLDRQVLLTNWADSFIIPGYERFDQKFQQLKIETGDFQQDPTAQNLQDLRDALKASYTSWQEIEMFEVGPAEQVTLRNFFNIYPADIEGISANISEESPILNLPSSYSRQGFPALDYLVNGVGAEDEDILGFYQDDLKGEQRLDYLMTLVGRMNELLSQVISTWKSGYREEFISKTGLDIGSSMGGMVNAFTLYYERHVRTGKIGIPSGATIATGGNVNPEKLESFYYPSISRELAITANQASMDFFLGKSSTGTGASFKSYLDGIGAKDPSSGTLLSSDIQSQFELVQSKLKSLDPNLLDQINSDNSSMIDVHTEMQKLVRLLKVDMSSAMSITITYTDNDGD
ncbi:imelysin family protein [Algoriphagus aestuarii]|nr:imelysin family protein [Algoriphagus aestuarii]